MRMGVAARMGVAEQVPPGPTAATASRASVSSSTTIGSTGRPQCAEQLVVEHELGRREAVERRQDAGRVQDEVGPGRQGRLETKGRFGAGLSVGHVGVGERAAGAHRQAEQMTELDRGRHSGQYSGAPMSRAPLRMDDTDDVPPYRNGQPRWASWREHEAREQLRRAGPSSRPASVSGAVVPAIAQALTQTGWSGRARRSSARPASTESCSGEVVLITVHRRGRLVPTRRRRGSRRRRGPPAARRAW